MKRYCRTGRRNNGRPLKRLLDSWDRKGSTIGPTPWQIYDDDNDDDDDDDDDERFVDLLVNTMPRNRIPRVMKHYCRTGRRNNARHLKRVLDTWDRKRSTSGPTPW
jgi:hypothetical protein